MLNRLFVAFTARPLLGVMLLVGLTVALVPFATRVGLDNGVDVWFVEGDPVLEAYREFQATFGNDELVVIGVDTPGGAFTAENLTRLRDLSAAVGELEGVRRVLSLTTLNTIASAGDTLEVGPIVDAAAPLDAAAAAAAKSRYDADPLLQRGLVAADGQLAVLAAQMRAMDDMDARRHQVLAAMQKTLHERAPGAWRMSGTGVIYNDLNLISQREGALFAGLSQFLILLLLLAAFRRPGPVALALGAVGLATAWTFGLYGLFGRDVNMVTMILPTLVLVIGIADAVHLLRHRAASAAPLPASLAFIAVPCLFTTLTTAAGFAALGSSRMAVVRDLGLFGAAGVAFALIATFVLFAVAMRFGWANPHPAPPQPGKAGPAAALPALLERLTDRVIAHRLPLAGAALVVLCGAAVGITRITADTWSLGFLPDDHRTVTATAELEGALGPFTPLELTVRTAAPEGAKDPKLLKGMAAWQAALEQHPKVGRTISLADVVARLHHVLSGEAPAIPDDPDQVWQSLALYEQDDDNDTAHLTDGARRTARITAAVRMDTAAGFAEVIDHALALGREHLPADVEVAANGYLPLYVRMMTYVVDSQVRSFALAFAVVFVLFGLLFRSLPMAALALLPNLFPIFVMLGVMGALGIHLDVATVTITAIVIGIAVDDTIHYLFRYRAERAAHPDDVAAALRATARAAGPPIVLTTGILAVGFSALLLASVKSIAAFGLLTITALVAAVIGDLVFLPALLALAASNEDRTTA